MTLAPLTSGQLTTIRNERFKLTAGATNTVAVATIVTGIVVPAIQAVYGVPTALGPWVIVSLSLLWLIVGAALHLIGWAILGNLR